MDYGCYMCVKKDLDTLVQFLYKTISQKCVYLILSILVLQGCVGFQSFPHIARGGDTITLAAGSYDGMNKANTTALFISDVDASSVALPIRSIIKIRPDNTSEIATFDNIYTGNIEYYNSHSPWLSIIIVDLPQGLTVGTGKIHITTTSRLDLGANVNNYPIKIDIIDGVGNADGFDYYSGGFGKTSGNIARLEPMQQVVIRPPVITDGWFNAGFYGAAEIKVSVPTQKIGGGDITASSLKIVLDDMFYTHNASQTHMIWSRNGDVYTIYYVSPTARMRFYSTRVSLVLRSGNEFLGTPQLLSVKYYDANGALITDSTPTSNDYTITIENAGI